MQSNRPENSNDPLTPVELFRRGIEITQEIRGRIEESRAYYLGRSSREPEEPLSEVFNPETGPIIPYFVKVIRMLAHPQAYLTLRQSAALTEFERESARTLDALRRLAIDLAPVLNAKDGQPAIGRSLKLSIYFFRAANRRFFRYLVRRRSILHRLLGNQMDAAANHQVHQHAQHRRAGHHRAKDAGMPRSGNVGCRLARQSKASAKHLSRLRKDFSFC